MESKAITRLALTRRDAYYGQWAAQFFAAAELTRRGYIVSFPLGNAPVTDLQATSPKGSAFSLEVKGLRSPNFWLIRRPHPGRQRIYILVLAPQEEPFKTPRYFLLTEKDLLSVLVDNPKPSGVNWGAALKFENCWNILPQ